MCAREITLALAIKPALLKYVLEKAADTKNVS